MPNEDRPRLEVAADAEAAALLAARAIAATLRSALDIRGRAALALSGGRSPQRMLEILATQDLPWAFVDVFQVDERVAPAGHPDRNAVTLMHAFENRIAAHPQRFHWMPVEEPSLATAARRYAAELRVATGPGDSVDVVHLGLGGDGHTASLFPGSPLLNASGEDVLPAPPHQGRERMTLTFDAINRAGAIVWFVTGAQKREVLAGLVAGNAELVASRVRRSGAVVFADAAAAAA